MLPYNLSQFLILLENMLWKKFETKKKKKIFDLNVAAF